MDDYYNVFSEHYYSIHPQARRPMNAPRIGVRNEHYSNSSPVVGRGNLPKVVSGVSAKHNYKVGDVVWVRRFNSGGGHGVWTIGTIIALGNFSSKINKAGQTISAQSFTVKHFDSKTEEYCPFLEEMAVQESEVMPELTKQRYVYAPCMMYDFDKEESKNVWTQCAILGPCGPNEVTVRVLGGKWHGSTYDVKNGDIKASSAKVVSYLQGKKIKEKVIGENGEEVKFNV